MSWRGQLRWSFDTVLADVVCTLCGEHIRTVRRADGTVESEYCDAQGRCWYCAKVVRQKFTGAAHGAQGEPATGRAKVAH